MTRFFPLLLAAAASLTAPALADKIYVNAGLTTGANDGTSWADAYQGPGGLDLALASREFLDEIWVTRGRYRPGVDIRNGRFTFLIEGRAVILGGFVGVESSAGERLSPEFARTILDGDLAGDDLTPGGSRDDNARHVVSLVGASGLIDRVTVERGFAGGGVLCGGAVEDAGATPSFTEFKDCTFRDNEAQLAGGAVASLSLGSSCRFLGCLFENNRVGSFGGGLYLQTTGDTVVERCEFRTNSAGAGGGMCVSFSSIATVGHTVFVDNESRAAFGGGAVFLYLDGSMGLRSSTLVGNRALAAAEGGISTLPGFLEVSNSILWGNAGAGGGMAAANQLSVRTGVSYSHVQGWSFGGVGNSSADPMLANPLGGDFEPLSGSPVIDAAGAVPLADRSVGDFLGKRRRVDDPQTPDMGAGPGAVMDIGAVERSVGAIGTMTCIGGLNASGQHGAIDAFGSKRVNDNSVVLVASQLPTHQFGIFLVARNVGPVLSPNGILLCLPFGISRFVGPGQVLSSGANGQFSLALDLTAIPSGSGFASVRPGQSWSFQGWHRDPAGINSSNFTDATTVAFE